MAIARGEFFVPGKPEQKGSTRSFAKKGKIVTVHDNPKTKGFQHRIALAAHEAGIQQTDGAVELELYFRMPRPKSLRKKRVWCTKRPDIDKLARTALDALSHVLYHDDSQVVGLKCHKEYEDERNEVGLIVMWRALDAIVGGGE